MHEIRSLQDRKKKKRKERIEVAKEQNEREGGKEGGRETRKQGVHPFANVMMVSNPSFSLPHSLE